MKFDCTRCSKDHNIDPQIGDMHHEYDGTLKSMIYNGSAWTEITHASSPFSSTSVSGTSITTSGTGMYGISSTPYTTYTYPSTTMTTSPITIEPAVKHDPNLFDKYFDNDELPNRDIYIGNELNKHINPKADECNCGYKYTKQEEHILHMSRAVIDAADKWDGLIMDGDDMLDTDVA